MPTTIGYQDLAALIARQPAVTERWRAHMRSSTFGTIQATFSFPRPIGSSIPDPYFTQLAALDPRALDFAGSVPLPSPIEPQAAAPRYDFPVVQRRLKGDRLPLATAPLPVEPEQKPISQPGKMKDQASLTPGSKPEPLPAEPESVAERWGSETPLARKGDREAVASVSEPEESPQFDAALDNAGPAAGQAAEAVRASGSIRRLPVAVAAKPASARRPHMPSKADRLAATVKRARDAALQRSHLAASKAAQATVAAGGIERKLVPVATPAQDAALQLTALGGEQAAQAIGIVDSVLSALRESVEVAEQAAPAISKAAEPVAVAPQAKAGQPQIAAPHEPSVEANQIEPARVDVNQAVAEAPVAQAPKLEPLPEAPADLQLAPAKPAPLLEPSAPQKLADRFQSVDSFAQYSSPQSTRIYFGTHEIGFGKGGLQQWEPDEVPTVLAPPHVDPEIKRAALDPQPDADNEKPGETVARKGEVTGEGHRPRTPAERLNLAGASRAKHEKCLANAIYFEARGEVERGQMAVAQVILNRAFSGYYPGNVCDVVYQNAHRHLACQFTFACDNVRDVIKDQQAWSVATRIASDALDGKFWLPEIGKATHYHATYVKPWWVRTMTKHSKLGIHIFYRPTRWGAGDEIPVWGDRLDVTGAITPMKPEQQQELSGKSASAQPVRLRSIFDPVEEIKPGG